MKPANPIHSLLTQSNGIDPGWRTPWRLSRKSGPEHKRLGPLTGVSFAFIIASMLFQDNCLIGYGLLGVGIIIAIVDIIIKIQHKED